MLFGSLNQRVCLRKISQFLLCWVYQMKNLQRSFNQGHLEAIVSHLGYELSCIKINFLEVILEVPILNFQRYELYLPFKRKIIHFWAKFPWLFIQPYQLSLWFCSLLFHGHCLALSSSCQGLELGFVAYRFIEHLMFSPHMRHCVFRCKSSEVFTANIFI